MNPKIVEPVVYIPPMEIEIDQTFELIYDRLNEPVMKLAINQQVRIGYENSLDILDGTKTMADISEIKGVQASAITMLAIDYLTGECSQKILLGVPLKNGIKSKIN